MPITALPSPWGIGTLGKDAREFLDFLADSGQTYWQMLPIGPTGYGDSPYQPFSSYGGNPYFIDLDDLWEAGLLERRDYADLDWGTEPGRVDYGLLYQRRFHVLRKAVERLWRAKAEAVGSFCRAEAHWLEDYALFMALKDSFGGAPWQSWPEELRRREPRALVEAGRRLERALRCWKGGQVLFFSQWARLKGLAERKGISIIGDLPIYVAGDSADVWAHPEQFQMDDDLRPTRVAGCPPDGFSADGQLWGNPLFDWERMRKDGYRWWMRRIAFQFRFYDVLRIDHFRGFDSYYAIPASAENAVKGTWEPGPGIAFFQEMEKAVGKKSIIAEDLGFLTPSVQKLLADTGYPGMKILEFAFDSRDGSGRVYQPHNYPAHCVAYVGTHDNDTALGWLATAEPEDAALAREYLHLDPEEGENWGMMRAIWSSAAGCAIVQMQDLLGLGAEGRMNTPSTQGGNWQWRALPGFGSPALARRLRRQMELYERLPNKEKREHPWQK